MVQWLRAINEKLNLIDNVFGAYVTYRGDNEAFEKYIEDKTKEVKKEKPKPKPKKRKSRANVSKAKK